MANAKIDEWRYSPQRVRGAAEKENAPSWYGRMMLGRSVDVSETAVEVGKETNLNPYQVLHVYDRRDAAIIRALRSGRNVNTPLVGYTISMAGPLPTLDASFDPKVNALVAGAYAKPPLRDCLEGIIPHNTVGHLTAGIGSVMDAAAQEDGVQTVPEATGVGYNMLIGPQPDEWLKLLTKKGEIVATPEIISNDSGRVVFTFGVGFAAIEDGEYVLELRARNGASTDYAPAVASKSITIRKAG